MGTRADFLLVQTRGVAGCRCRAASDDDRRSRSKMPRWDSQALPLVCAGMKDLGSIFDFFRFFRGNIKCCHEIHFISRAAALFDLKP
jgi:hypothetical protein